MKKQPTVVITGAGGFIGSEIVARLSTDGWRVRALVRNPANYKSRKNVTYTAYDMERTPLDETFKGADYLVHTAYIKDDKSRADALRLNVEAARNLLSLSREYKLKRNIFLSSMSSAEQASAVYGRQKFAIEKLFNTKMDTVLRLGLVIGKGGLINELITFMRRWHVAPLIDGGVQPIQTIGVSDVAAIVEKILQDDIAGCFTVASPEVYTYREFYLVLREKLDLKVWFLSIPFSLVLVVLRAIKATRLPLTITEDNLWGLKELKAQEVLPSLAAIGIPVSSLYDAIEETKQK